MVDGDAEVSEAGYNFDFLPFVLFYFVPRSLLPGMKFAGIDSG